MSSSELQDLLRKVCIDSDQRAFKKLIIEYNISLHHLAYNITGNWKEAEEVVADVFIKIWQRRARLMKLNNIHFYLYTSTRNISIDYLRKFHKQKKFDISDFNLPIDYRLNLTPENLLITRELAEKINIVINQLPSKCKLIFRLVKEDGLKHKEVAELLNISIKTVEAQIAIALKKLQASISVYLPDYSQIHP